MGQDKNCDDWEHSENLKSIWKESTSVLIPRQISNSISVVIEQQGNEAPFKE